jgi:carbonic anhydrase
VEVDLFDVHVDCSRTERYDTFYVFFKNDGLRVPRGSNPAPSVRRGLEEGTPMCERHEVSPSRRAVLGGLALGATGLIARGAWAAGGAGGSGAGGKPGPSPAIPADDTTPANPDEALARLYAGNRRFVDGKVTAPNRNLERLRAVAPKQTPFAAFLGCADSRVPIEIVFDQGFGDVFVTRIAGNVADPAIIGSLEFGTAVLGAKVLYVLGHTACGAVAATVAGNAVPGQISTLYQHIRPAAKAARGDVERAIIANVKNQMETLAEASPVIGTLVKDGALEVAGGVYDLTSGKVTPVEVG